MTVGKMTIIMMKVRVSHVGLDCYSHYYYVSYIDEEEVWSTDPSSDIDDDCTPPNLRDHDQSNPASSGSVSKTLCTWMVLFLSHFQAIFYLPDRALDVLL